jgi:hypothetical protein
MFSLTCQSAEHMLTVLPTHHHHPEGTGRREHSPKPRRSVPVAYVLGEEADRELAASIILAGLIAIVWLACWL